MIGKNPLIFAVVLIAGGLFVLYTWWGDKSPFGIFGSISGFFALGVGLLNLLGTKKQD